MYRKIKIFCEPEDLRLTAIAVHAHSSVLIGLEQSTEIPQTLALTIPYNYRTQPI